MESSLVNIFDTIIVQPIFNMLLGLYSIIPGGDFGIAIIIFTVLIRFALWPLVKKQLHQTKAMQKMQPALAKIKKEANGNKQVESMRMMELYKEYDVNPFSSIGVLFIQLPIFIALYQVIRILATNRSEVAKYTYGFMKGIEPIKALIANPDHFNQNFLGFIDLTKQAISSNPMTINIILLILAVGAAVTQYIMTKQTSVSPKSGKRLRDIMTEAADGKQADQSEMNAIMMSKMTKFMPIMMFMIMIYMPGALVLYYTVSNLVAVIQQHNILKKDSEELIKIADAETTKPGKKATEKARIRAENAQEATVIRIVAKDTAPKRVKNKE